MWANEPEMAEKWTNEEEEIEEGIMKITKRQLKRIIREMWSRDPHGNEAEYSRGYQDGFDEVPPADDATADYDVGYEEGAHDASMDDDKDEERWYKS